MFTFINISLLCISLINAASIKQGEFQRQTSAPLLELPERQAKQLGLLFAAKNVSLTMEFKQVPGTSGTLVSINAGNVITSPAFLKTLPRQRSRPNNHLLQSWHHSHSIHEQRWCVHACR
jgi:hypothetical protein